MNTKSPLKCLQELKEDNSRVEYLVNQLVANNKRAEEELTKKKNIRDTLKAELRTLEENNTVLEARLIAKRLSERQAEGNRSSEYQQQPRHVIEAPRTPISANITSHAVPICATQPTEAYRRYGDARAQKVMQYYVDTMSNLNKQKANIKKEAHDFHHATKNARLAHICQAQNSSITSFVSVGDAIVLGRRDGILQLVSDTSIMSSQTSDHPTTMAAIGSNMLAVGSKLGEVSIWSIDEFGALKSKSVRLLRKQISQVCYNKSVDSIIATCTSGEWNEIDCSTNDIIRTWNCNYSLDSCALQPIGREFCTASKSADGAITFWDLREKLMVNELKMGLVQDISIGEKSKYSVLITKEAEFQNYFIKEKVLGKPVPVDLGETAVTLKCGKVDSSGENLLLLNDNLRLFKRDSTESLAAMSWSFTEDMKQVEISSNKIRLCTDTSILEMKHATQ